MSERKIGRITDIENRVGLIERAGKEKAEEHQEIDAEISPNAGPDDATTTPVNLFDRFLVGRRCGFCIRGDRRSRRGRCLCYLYPRFDLP